MDEATDPAPPPAPWEVARDLRWSIARGVLLDPLAWLGTLVAAWALARTDLFGSAGGVLGLLALATAQADHLLFRDRGAELLRTQPLGEDGFARVCQAELGWWLHPGRILAAAAVLPDGGWAVAFGAWLLGSLAAPLGCWLAIAFRRSGGSRRHVLLWLAPLACTIVPGRLSWEPLLVLGAGFAAGPAFRRAFVLHHGRLASRAATRARRRRSLAWPLARLLSLPALRAPLRARLTRDLVLTLRGQDLPGALLLLLSPLSCLVMVDELANLPSRAALPWRVLTTAALGGAAVAYAAGPGIHRLRNRAMAWERTAPRPGARAMTSALQWSMGLALLHGALTLGILATTQGGRFAPEAASLALPVLALELAMAHYVAVFTMGATAGRRVIGESTLVLSLPVVAIGVAIVGVLYPLAALLYFVVTVGMVAAGRHRYEQVEVTW